MDNERTLTAHLARATSRVHEVRSYYARQDQLVRKLRREGGDLRQARQRLEQFQADLQDCASTEMTCRERWAS
ncbi:hypothetical protein [Rubellimicrobium arenae]|uniref:hypothetical protein n=1 Tax=Rubellimicrobium arenae TaxID=2817372 RepID=UPI001B308DBF|nr:hypothetical protein [Rubellimicrobium arenae]